jgi:hypothetical protein
MSTDAMTMQDLELEHAELLPNRETLWSGGGITRSFNSQHAFLSGNNVASGDNVQVNGINLFGQQGGDQYASATAVGNLIG